MHVLLCSNVFVFVFMGGSLLCFHSLGPHQVLVLEGRPLQVDDSLRPQRDLEDSADLNVYLCRTQNHHVIVLHNRETQVLLFQFKKFFCIKLKMFQTQ